MPRHLVDEPDQLFPVVRAHDHDRKVFDLSGLNQRHCFEQFVERARAAGHNNESVGILYQERFADEEIVHPHTAIEIGVRWLLRRELNGAADRAATNFFGAAVRGFHDTRSPAGDDSEPEPRNRRAHFSSQLVIRIVALNARRSKHSHTWTDEVKRAKSAQEITHHPQKGEELSKTRTRPFEEDLIGTFRRHSRSRSGGLLWSED